MVQIVMVMLEKLNNRVMFMKTKPVQDALAAENVNRL